MAILSLPLAEGRAVNAPAAASRIVHVIAGLLMGGAETTLYKLLRLMDRRKFEHAVISLADGDWPLVGRIRELGVPVYHAGVRATLPTPAAAARLARLVRDLEPDLMQGWMYHGNLAAQLTGPWVCPGVPVIWNVCATQFDLKREKITTSLAIWLGGRLSSFPNGILTDSMASARGHQERLGYSSHAWQVIPNGFDLEKFRPSEEGRQAVRQELCLEEDALVVGLIGRYQAVKDHAGFLEAAAIVRRHAPTVRFLLMGRGVSGNAALTARSEALGLSAAIHFLGERTDVPAIAGSLDIAVSSSYSESFPNVVGEAMSCGVPCVVTDVGDSAHLVGEAGIVVPPRNPAALAEAVLDLIRRGSEARRALGLQARERIARHFSIDAIVGRYEEFYSQMLLRKPPGGYSPCAA